MLIKKLTLILLLIMSAAGISFAATYYVDANSGNDSNPGTSSTTAWNSISKVNAMSFNPGDNILFLRGCTWTGMLNFNSSGNSSTQVVYDAYGSGSLPVIDGNNISFAGHIISQNYITVQNIKFQNASGEGTLRIESAIGIIVRSCEFYLTAHGAVFLQNSSNCDITGNSVTTPLYLNVETDGIYSQKNSNNIYENNHIIISNSEATHHDDCIQSYEDNSLIIRNNYCEQADKKLQNAQGIYMTDGTGNFQLYNNVVKCPDNQANIVGFDNDVTGNASLQFYNNTVIGGGPNTLRVLKAPNITVINNILVSNALTTLIDIEGSLGASAVIDYNLYYHPGTGSIINYSPNGSLTFAQWQALGYDAHGLNTNPMLDDSLYPSSNAPEVNRGSQVSGVYDVDKLGTPRPQGGGTDMGAYEFNGSVQAVNSTNFQPLKNYELAQNYPNPFNPSTVIKYSIADASHVTIKVYDITGRLVRELVNEDKSSGQYTAEFRGNNLASGTYIYTITAGSYTQSNKMILLK